MAYATCGSSAVQNAILQVWTPAVGARSVDKVVTRNVEKFISSSKLNSLDLFSLCNYIPHPRLNVPIEEVSEDQPPFVIREGILSGSWSEGLFFYGRSNTSTPDLDFMFVLEHRFHFLRKFKSLAT